MRKISILLLILGTICGCEVPKPILPSITLIAVPAIGDTIIYCEFWVESLEINSTIQNNYKFEWDFDGDLTIDFTAFGAMNSIHKYSLPGKYSCIVSIVDQFGQKRSASIEVEIIGVNQNVDTLVDPRDGQQYKTVLLGSRWWMAENLRYGKEIELPVRQTNNGIVEKYVKRLSSGTAKDELGGVYHWNEATDYSSGCSGICPEGWHIPNNEDWNGFFDSLSQMNNIQYLNYVTSNLAGVNFNNGIKLDLSREPNFGREDFNQTSYFWSSTKEVMSDYNIGRFAISTSRQMSGISSRDGRIYDYHLSVRCVRDD